MSSTWKDKVIVASIDFGTTHSGFALSFLGEYELDSPNVYKIYTHTWKSGDQPMYVIYFVLLVYRHHTSTIINKFPLYMI